MMSRDELYALVWSEPMTKIGEQLGVSGSYLARICTLLGVPRPERGYWAKLAVGKAPAQPPLPDPQPGDPLHWSKDGETPPPPKPRAPPRRAAPKQVRIARNQLHSLIRGARHHYEKGREVEEGAYLKPYKKLLVDVTASLAGLDKALDVANDLFNAFASLGHRVVIAPADASLFRSEIEEREIPGARREYWQHNLWSPYRPTVVYIGTVAIGLAVIEMSEHVTLRYLNGKYVRETEATAQRSRYDHGHSWTTTRDVPSGRLRIVAYSPYRGASWVRHWDEGKSSSLHSLIRAIVTDVEKFVPELVEKIEEAERQAQIRHQEWLAQQERWRREEDRRQIEKSVAESKADLKDIIARWADVMSVEQFFAGVEQRAAHLAEDESIGILDRLALARASLGSQDPLDFFRGWKTAEERYSPKHFDRKL